METVIHKESAGGVIIKDDTVLLIKSEIRNSYSFPKGTIDPGETKEVAAIREVKEETGYNAQIIDLLDTLSFEFTNKDGNHLHKTVTYYHMRLTDDKDPEPNLQPGEDFVNVWAPIDEAYQLLTYDDAKQILKLAAARA